MDGNVVHRSPVYPKRSATAIVASCLGVIVASCLGVSGETTQARKGSDLLCTALECILRGAAESKEAGG